LINDVVIWLFQTVKVLRLKDHAKRADGIKGERVQFALSAESYRVKTCFSISRRESVECCTRVHFGHCLQCTITSLSKSNGFGFDFVRFDLIK
jgi:hypothetical protein